jgi:hypothetical protein
VLAELCRRDLVPALWVPSLSDRELRERLNRRAHLRLRTAAKNRVFGALSQWGLRIPLRVLRGGDATALLERRGLPEVTIVIFMPRTPRVFGAARPDYRCSDRAHRGGSRCDSGSEAHSGEVWRVGLRPGPPASRSDSSVACRT